MSVSSMGLFRSLNRGGVRIKAWRLLSTTASCEGRRAGSCKGSHQVRVTVRRSGGSFAFVRLVGVSRVTAGFRSAARAQASHSGRPLSEEPLSPASHSEKPHSGRWLVRQNAFRRLGFRWPPLRLPGLRRLGLRSLPRMPSVAVRSIRLPAVAFRSLASRASVGQRPRSGPGIGFPPLSVR